MSLFQTPLGIEIKKGRRVDEIFNDFYEKIIRDFRGDFQKITFF